MALAFASVAHAQEQCRAIPEPTERLACFDKSLPEKTSPGRWQIKESSSKLDRSRQVVASLPASEANVSRSIGNKEEAALIIRCREKKTDLYFVFFSSLIASASSPNEISYRIGDNKAATARWSGSQDGRAFGPWDDQSTIPFIKRLLAAKDIFVRSEARYLGTAEASFDLQGIEEAIRPVREACSW